MELLDYKINYILSKESEINSKIYSRIDKQLGIEGTAVFKYAVTIRAILQLLTTSILTFNLKLELYKKLLHLLRFFGLIFKIPDLTESESPILYWGAGDPGLNVAGLQTLIQSQQEFTTQLAFSYTLTNQVYYFCYPADKGILSSILDNNGFETLPGWTLRTESFIFPGSANITYNVYEFNNITTQASFTNTFIL
jgi:hypothetical protein